MELWWAIQMERRYTKQEILEMYLNEMPFGSGNLGVQAASKFYFNHPVQEDTVAESAMLVIQLASPSLNNPIRNPAAGTEAAAGDPRPDGRSCTT